MKVMIEKVVPGHICAAFFELLELHHEAFFDCLSRSRLSPQNAESLVRLTTAVPIQDGVLAWFSVVTILGFRSRRLALLRLGLGLAEKNLLHASLDVLISCAVRTHALP